MLFQASQAERVWEISLLSKVAGVSILLVTIESVVGGVGVAALFSYVLMAIRGFTS